MEITGATTNPVISEYTFGVSSGVMNGESGAPAAVSGGGDTAVFSLQAQALAASPASALDETTFSASSFTTNFGANTVGFNNTSGAISWNGKVLNFTGLGIDIKGNTTDLAIQEDSGYLNVYDQTANQCCPVKLPRITD